MLQMFQARSVPSLIIVLIIRSIIKGLIFYVIDALDLDFTVLQPATATSADAVKQVPT